MMDDAEPMQIDIVEDLMNENNDNDMLRPPLAEAEEIPEDTNFVVENATLDLESYSNSYTGMAKLLRLNHVAEHCPALRLDALKMALAHVSTTMNVDMYQQLHKKLRSHTTLVHSTQANAPDVANANVNGAGGGGPDGGPMLPQDIPPVDSQWIEQTSKRCATMLDKLDIDLKNYKSNSIKESIRRGYDDVGEFYLECGDMMNALKSFTRSRDYCTSAKHVINMCLNIIKVSIYLQNWNHVSNYVMKAENTPDPSDEKKVNAKEVAQITSKLRCAAGLADLASKKYKSAAKLFLQINFEHFECPDMISQSNVTTYAALCALASFTRAELQEQVISSSSFKPFLELEPPIREVIYCFYESKYAKCLQLLDDMRENLLLDMYLAQHIRTLYSQIRSRGLIQYFAPYASADMNKMATSFNTTVPQLENELMSLILSGSIQGRIDSQNKVLYVKNEDERSCIFEKALKVGSEYERRTKLMILRTAMLRAQIQVKNPLKDENQPRGSGAHALGIRPLNNHL